MKIAVIGYSGAGKSTLARRLGEAFGEPVLHLDAVGWSEGWRLRDVDEARSIMTAFLDAHDGWVVEGNWSKLDRGRRYVEADLTVMLDFPRSVACGGRGGAIFRAEARNARTWPPAVRRSSTSPSYGGSCATAGRGASEDATSASPPISPAGSSCSRSRATSRLSSSPCASAQAKRLGHRARSYRHRASRTAKMGIRS